MITPIIFTGRAQSGKSTSAEYLRGTLQDSYIFSFADALKDFCIDVFGLNHTQVYGTNEEKNTLTHIRWNDLPLSKKDIDSIHIELCAGKGFNEFMTGREVLQVFGSQICRKMYPDCWAFNTLKRIASLEQDYYPLPDQNYALIADARFPNEIEIFRNQNIFDNVTQPVVIRLTRNPIKSDHISETALDNYHDYDIVIDNANMTLDRKDNYIATTITQLLRERGLL